MEYGVWSMSQDSVVSTVNGLRVSETGVQISGAAKDSYLLQKKTLTGSEIHSNSNSMCTGVPPQSKIAGV